MRLDRFLANAGVGTRSETPRLIRAGRVAVAGVTVKDPAYAVKGERVTLDATEVVSAERLILAIDKPAGVVSATEDRRETTVVSLLPKPYRGMKLAIVGRLDKDTEGLLLLTTDGRFVHEVTSPKNKIPKTYYLETDTELFESDAEKIRSGVSIGEGENVKGEMILLSERSAELTITEGKFHQVKRMLFALQKEVTYLRRERIGKLRLKDLNLEPGEARIVDRSSVL